MPATADAQLLPLSELTTLAAAYRKQIDAEDAEVERERIAQSIADAATDAHQHITELFPATLARVLPATAWAGYSEDDRNDGDQDHDAVAIAHLSDGMWLRHVLHVLDDGDRVVHEVGIISPCACGEYIETRVQNDYVLAQVLESLTRREDCDCF